MGDDTIINVFLAAGAFLIQVIAIVFVARVSRDYQLTAQGVDGLQTTVKAIAARERRNKLLAEQLYLLATLQARFSRGGMSLMLSMLEARVGGAGIARAKASLDQLADEIEIAADEVGIFSDSAELRSKALRSLAFARCGANTVSLLDDLIELDLENAEDYKTYRRQLVTGLWTNHHRASDWTGRPDPA